MKIYAAVVRVSHMGERKQDDETFHADRDQVSVIDAWAKANHARIDVLPPELNVSGGLPIEKRPSLLAAIEGVERGVYSGIAVAYLSRLGRNVTEQLRTWERVEAAGGEIVSVREGIDTSTASGRLHRNLLISIDAHEREQHAERFDERRRLATAAGIWQRRQVPRGYQKGNDRRLAPATDAEEVTSTFSDLLRGTAVSELARRLQMTPGGARYLLRNRVYLGELKVGEYVNPEAHPALVDARTFDEVQRKLGQSTRPARIASEGPALLSGVIRCSSCGHIMTRGSGRKGHGRVYLCVKKHSGRHCPAPAGIAAERVDRYVESIAKAELARLQVEASEGDDVTHAQNRVEAAEHELDAYLDAVRAADVGAEAFGTGARKRSAAVEAAKDSLYAELARRPVSPAVGSGADVWEELNAHERNTLLRGLLAAVVVRPVGRGRRVPVEDRVRVLAYGTDLGLPSQRGHLGSGIVPIAFPDPDEVGVLTRPPGEDSLEAVSGAA
jgi:site-specific DNA recombinase